MFITADIAGDQPRLVFDWLYRSMLKSVASFARTGTFDYLTMLGKMQLANIEPGSTYMTGATGPLSGARLLFGDTSKSLKPATLDAWLVDLESHLNIAFGMQVLEDALCNWQKNPRVFLPFRG